MLLSTILTEEDEILEQYQEAIDAFKTVLEKSDGKCWVSLLSIKNNSPNTRKSEPNPKLAEMVKLLDGEDNSDEEVEDDSS